MQTPSFTSFVNETETEGTAIASFQDLLIPHGRTVQFLFSNFIAPILLIIACNGIWKSHNYNLKDLTCNLPLPPGNFGLPFIGETLNFVLLGSKFYKSRRENFGHVYKTHILGRPTIRVIGSKNVRKILNGENTIVTTHWSTSTRMILGGSCLSQSVGSLHRQRRKLVAKAFSHDALSSYVKPMQRIVKSHIEKWCFDEVIFGYQECRNLTFALAAKILLGFNLRQADIISMLHVFEDVSNNIISIPIQFPGGGLTKGLRAKKILLEKIGECIKKRQEENCSQTYVDALSLLLNDQSELKMAPDELKEIALELLFAGHETTASAACTLLMQLAKHPEVTEKIRDELHANGITESGPINYDSINGLSYVSNVVKEVLRIAPPIGGGFRKALKTFELDGYQVPAGWTVIYSIRDTQETSSMFDDVTDFNPDRWADFKGHMTPEERYQYVPFGGGKRSCIGKEFAKLFLKVMTVELSRSSTWKLHNNNPQMKYLPVPHPKDNLPLTMSPLPGFRSRSYTL
ncbi:cytochrome P450 26B1-like [Lineus longissimus]|uniref:cytochrome P450 26B1-like n=1 Tax=Lineus longissimus TaxID=88925 RepID=UPI002B4D922F